VVVGNSWCRDPAPNLACRPVHAQAPRVEPFSRAKDKPKLNTGSQSSLRCPSQLELVAEVLALVVTDAGGDSSAALPSSIIIAVLHLLNAAIYVGSGLILWTFVEVFSRFFQRRARQTSSGFS
jgi:hypothetical protein